MFLYKILYNFFIRKAIFPCADKFNVLITTLYDYNAKFYDLRMK